MLLIATQKLFLSHITSATALIFPVKEIIDLAKQKNILTIIDGLMYLLI